MGTVSTSKRSGAGKSVLVFFIVFIILEMLIVFGVGKVFKNEEVTPSVMGYSLFLTKEDLLSTGGETATVAVPKKVLVIASEGLNDAGNKVGHAVLCENVDGVGTGVFWLASTDMTQDNAHMVYTVANGSKTFEVGYSDVIGECASYFVTAGKVISFITSKFGMICCAVVPLFLLVLIELIIAIATHSSDDDDDDEDEDEEEREVELDDFLFGGKSEGEQIARKRRKTRVIDEDEDDEDFAPVRKRRRPVEEDDDDEDFAPAKKRRKPVVEEDDEEEVPAPVKKKKQPVDDFERLAPKPERPAKQEKKPVAEKPVAVEQSAPEEAPAAKGSLSLREDEKMSEYYEKASKMVDGENGAAAPAGNRRPARRRPPQRRRPASSGMSSDASLEDLMKLMEEEQNKLKNSMK